MAIARWRSQWQAVSCARFVLAGVALAESYTACAPGRFGPRCEGQCRCSSHEDCDDGITGDGTCTCMLGHEAHCSGTMAAMQRLFPEAEPSQPEGLGGLLQLLLINSTLLALRMDPETSRRSRQVRSASISRVLPVPWKAPRLRLALFNPFVAECIGLAPETAGSDALALAEVFGGRSLLPGSQPFSHAYGGHQFGNWAGQLGDGRAISLGEALGFPPGAAPHMGLRTWPWEVALKGAGRTPYSRGGDGRAALANAAREFFAPIFLQACGVPTTATLSVVASDSPQDRIVRDEWYDGNVARKKPGIVARISPTFLRFGSLQLASKRQGADGLAAVVRFALAAIARLEAHDDGAAAYLAQLLVPVKPLIREECFFARRAEPSCAAKHAALEAPDLFRCLLERATERTAALVAAWMATGFAHGVMNTDNLSILGITIDLNVYAFLSRYDTSWAPNHIDEEARYAFGAQREIAKWNLRRLADALTGTPFEEDHEPDAQTWARKERGSWLPADVADSILQKFDARHEACYVARMELRLGFAASGSVCGGEPAAPECLVGSWVRWLDHSGADFPRASRGLAEIGQSSPREEAARLAAHAGAGLHAGEGPRDMEADAELAAFLELFLQAHAARLGLGGDATADWRAAVRAAVPAFAPRTHVLREAARFVELEDGTGVAFLEALQSALRAPFDEAPHDLEAAWDHPQEAWRGVDIKRLGKDPEAVLHGMTVEAWLRSRLRALPPVEMQQLRTSCGAQ